MKNKILFLQEYLRENHMKPRDNGGFKNVFLDTKAGKILKDLAVDGLKLTRKDFYIDYAYQQVPKVLSRDRSNKAIKYKQPTATESSAEFEYLYERIVQDKPTIIIPSGNLGCKALLDQSQISKLRGVPQKVVITSKRLKERYGDSGTAPESVEPQDKPVNTEQVQTQYNMKQEELQSFLGAYGERMKTSKGLQSEHGRLVRELQELEEKLKGEPLQKKVDLPPYAHECWVLPTYSIEYMLINPNVQNLIEADFTVLEKFLEKGEKAFEASDVEYEHVEDIKRVREIFTQILPNQPVVSWDLETNTLHPERIGAKPLVISLAWKEGEGVTIPLEHKEFTWLPGYLAEIYNFIRDFVANGNIVKVGHNIQYDQRFLRLTKGFTEFNNHRDTKLMYYLLINQALETSLRLSDMAYELTDMGGYDRPLEEFKLKYKQDYISKKKAEVEEMKLAYKAEVKAIKEAHKLKVQEIKAEAKANKVKAVLPPAPEIPPKPDFPTEYKPVNEVDGSDFNYEWIPLKSFLSPYASGDVDCCLRIHNKLDAIGLKEENLGIRELYIGHYTELTDALAEMEANGVKMDVAYVEGLVDAYAKEEQRILELLQGFDVAKQLEEEIEELYKVGLEEFMKPKAERDKELEKLRTKYKEPEKRKFNPGSTEHKQKVLYKIPGVTLPYNKEFLSDSAHDDGIPEDDIKWYHYKTNKVALEYIVANVPEMKEFAETLLTYSLVRTRKQNFTYKLLALKDHNDLVHGSFNASGTETSRLASSDPNLQNIPRKTGDVTRFDYQHPIKRMFVSRFKNGVLLQADFGSLESRILALAAGDDTMTQAFLNDDDIHKETASLVFGVSIEEVTSDQRSDAKATTFGVAYGESPFSYAPKHGMTLEQAEELFEKFFRNKPRIREYIDSIHDLVKKQGYVTCLQGFRRNLRDVYSQDKSKKNGALRQSVNTGIQGSGAYLTNTSLIHINKFIKAKGLRSKLVLTVHDSIVADCPPEEVHIMAKVMKTVMENLPIPWLIIDWEGEKLRYPIVADIEIGLNYNDMVDYDKEEIESFNQVGNYCKYLMSRKKLKDYKESKVITEEKYEEMLQSIEDKKPLFQSA